MEVRQVTVTGPNGPQLAELRWGEGSGWGVSLALSDGDVVEAEDGDLYHSFQAVRERLESRGLTVCCQGARLDVRPSGMSINMGGGRRAYVLTAERPEGGHPLVDIFDPADCAEVATVQEQRDFYDAWLRRPR